MVNILTVFVSAFWAEKMFVILISNTVKQFWHFLVTIDDDDDADRTEGQPFSV